MDVLTVIRQRLQMLVRNTGVKFLVFEQPLMRLLSVSCVK